MPVWRAGGEGRHLQARRGEKSIQSLANRAAELNGTRSISFRYEKHISIKASARGLTQTDTDNDIKSILERGTVDPICAVTSSDPVPV